MEDQVLGLANKLTSLNNVDIDKVSKLVDKFGLYEAARIIGYDISHYDNLLMSGRLAIESLKQRAPKTFYDYALVMKERLHSDIFNFIMKNGSELQAMINEKEELDYDHDWFSGNTMITQYSAYPSHGEAPVETPQYTWMRIAVQFYHNHKNALKEIKKAYDDMAIGYYTPPSPTIFNAGMKQPQMASCFLMTIQDSLDSIIGTGIYNGAMISKATGGLGFDVSNVRHSEIGSIGMSNGIIPMLLLYNDMVRYVDQGGGFRKGAATIFLRPHHLDVLDFIELPRKVGDKHARAHDLNICLWTSWLFWERVKSDGDWTLFCPARAPQLNELYGKEFTEAYIAAELDPNIKPHHKKVIKARDLFNKILSVQRETGMPYLMNGDASNIKSNHRHLGYIKSSNLCLEVIQFTDENNIAVCNLHSLSFRMYGKGQLNKSLKDKFMAFRECVDFDLLSKISRRVLNNLNAVIDQNWYPLDKVKEKMVDGVKTKVEKPGIINKTNKRHRAVGMGASGFAELLHILDLSFEDNDTNIVNKMLFGCMDFNTAAQSVRLAIIDGAYETFEGSPTSEGKLQFDLWAEEFEVLGPNPVRKKEDDKPLSPETWGQKEIKLYDKEENHIDTIKPEWDDLKRCIRKYGLRNSLRIALMPTASTAQIRRNTESIEAPQTNLYSRKVLKCSYPVLNRYLVDDLQKLNLWNKYTVEYLRVKNGSIQNFNVYVNNNPSFYPSFTKDNERLLYLEKKYKTMWEIPQKVLINLAAERGRHIDQSASTNIFIKDCTDEKLQACHLYSNMKGLKTLMYYLRQTGGETIKFTADPKLISYITGLSVDVVKDDKSNKPLKHKLANSTELNNSVELNNPTELNNSTELNKPDQLTKSIDQLGNLLAKTSKISGASMDELNSSNELTTKKKYKCDDHSCCS